MKKTILLLCIAVFPIMLRAQKKPFTIDGTIVSDTLVTGFIRLAYEDGGEGVRDTAYIKNNKYHFSGMIADRAVTASLWLFTGDKENGGFAQFYAEGATKVKHTGRFSNFEVSGSPAQHDQLELGLRKNDGSSIVFQAAFIRQHPDSWVSFVCLSALTRAMKIPQDSSVVLYDLLSPALKQYKSVTLLGDKIKSRSTTGVGAMAPDFTQNDKNGRPVKLSSFRGKYVFLDFWASWCHPCRDESPFMLKAYQQFKAKNFEILGVSLDSGIKGREAWLKAVETDHTEVWTQVCDLKGAKNDAAILYGVMTIPKNFLIDPSGKIIAVNLRGEQLARTLEQIFK